MDEKDFKKHLKDLVHGHHHPDEHREQGDGEPRATGTGGGSGAAAEPGQSTEEAAMTETGDLSAVVSWRSTEPR